MSRTAQDVLEFDKLRELLRLRTTCAPGRRAVDALEFGTDRAALDAAFALIREAREWLRGGGELGFGGLADPQDWLEKIEGPGIVLEAKELLAAASLLETAAWLRGQFREDAAKFPLLAARVASLGDFREAAHRDPTMRAAEWRDQRRRVADAAPHSREHHPDARIDSENAEANPADRATRRPEKTMSRCEMKDL